MKRVFPTAIIAAVLALGLILFLWDLYSQAGPERPALTEIYYADNISEAHQAIIDEFNRLHAGSIRVVPVNLPFTKFTTNERKELLARSLRTRTDRIDIFSVDLIWVKRFARWAEPLDRYYSEHELSNFLPQSLESCRDESALVAIPLYADIGVMYYREDLLAKLRNPEALRASLESSITWEELFEIGKSRQYEDGPLYVFQAKNYEGLMCSFIEVFAANHGAIFDADSVQFNTLAARSSVQHLVNLVHGSGISPESVTGFDEFTSYDYSLRNDALLFRGWPGLLRQYTPVAEDLMKFARLRQAPLPHFRGKPPLYAYGGWNLMISKYSRKKNEALQFLKYFLDTKNQKMLFEMGGYIPAQMTVYKDESFMARHQELNFYRALLEHAVHRPYDVEYTKISDILSYYIYLAIRQVLPVEEALARATREINSQRVMIR